MTDTMPTEQPQPAPEEASPEDVSMGGPTGAPMDGSMGSPMGSPEGALSPPDTPGTLPMPEGEESPQGESEGPPEAMEGEGPEGMPAGAEEDPEIAAHMPIAEVVVGISHDYMIPMSEESLAQWVHHLVMQKASPEEADKTFRPYAEKIAEGLYPAFAAQIKKGVPVTTLVTPYAEVAKGMVGDDAQPNFNEPHWNAALTGGRDADGRPSPMNMQEWKKHVSSHPSFDYASTDHAKAKFADAVNHIKQAFTGGQQ